LAASATPVADIVTVAATIGDDGIVDMPGANGVGAFAVATTNLGASETITVALTLCQTRPKTGDCISPPSSSVSLTFVGNSTPTFAIFAAGYGTVPFDPAKNRVFVRFTGSDVSLRRANSV